MSEFYSPLRYIQSQFRWMLELTPKKLFSEVTAGIIVGIVALPLAIAFAIASGVSPEKGIATAVIGGIIISAFGGSRVQIGGPTGAFVVIVYGVLEQYGINGLMIATILAGIILVIMGVARLGAIIKFIPYPVVIGFTSGIALIIFSSQVRDIFGLPLDKVPADFIEKWYMYIIHFHKMNFQALAISAGSLALIILWQKFIPKVPASLIAIIVTTLIVYFFKLPVDTIGTRFGEIPNTLTLEPIHAVSFSELQNLFKPAFTIAILAGIEALLSCVVADGMTGFRHRSNRELIAQGVANIACPLFGGIPATGAIARTATNIRSGGRTPLSGIIHAVVLLLIVYFLGHWAGLIPLPTLAAILVIVSYNMSEWRSFRSLLSAPRSDMVVLLVTFFLTVIFDLTLAIQVGMILAVFLFMRRMVQVSNVGAITREFEDSPDAASPLSSDSDLHFTIPKHVLVYEINGPFFFGAAHKFQDAISEIGKLPPVLIIHMKNVPVIDSTAMHILEEVVKKTQKSKTVVILSGVHLKPMMAMEQAGLERIIGSDNIYGNLEEALQQVEARRSEATTK